MRLFSKLDPCSTTLFSGVPLYVYEQSNTTLIFIYAMMWNIPAVSIFYQCAGNLFSFRHSNHFSTTILLLGIFMAAALRKGSYYPASFW